ncbi:hypothetical protein [Thorsellia anophelis]|uniref:Lipoprotein n=1 Tax=Thorsellia anophelis DSM 18579 TaxID=1123402 RepID=A0A1I0EGL1_9GAMM|nr:hypothetical protein [Thorsellia anophelis]SET44215.1 hypothetical protein SAMN02583745_02375 [Thorsellia anophelis DSM 18579]
MKFSKFILASIFALGLVGCSESESDFKAKFTAECQKGAAGLSEDISVKLCDCTYDKLKEKLGATEFTEIYKTKTQDFLTASAQSAQICMADILRNTQ